MSVTMVAIPFFLLPSFIAGAQAAIITGGITAGVAGAAGLAANKIANGAIEEEQNFNKINNELKKMLQDNNGLVSKEMLNLICRDYETIFVSKDVLIKTLKEYGATDIYAQVDDISCEIDGFILQFHKPDPTDEMAFPPYQMKVATKCSEEELDEFIENINSEYTSNTQEENYIKIKERLDKRQMKISEEEILEDNSIVLTINID